MEVLLEKGFIEQFERDITNPDKLIKNRSLRKLLDLFQTYAEYDVYTDIPKDSILDYFTLREINNYCTATYGLESFYNKILDGKIGNQVLAFCAGDNLWKEPYEKMGGLYFTVNNYIEKIESILSIEKEIRFSNYQGEFTWNDIEHCTSLPYNSLLLIDSYVLSKPRIVKYNLTKILQLFSKKNNCKVFTILSTSGDKQNIKFSEHVVDIFRNSIGENKLSVEAELIAIYPKSMDGIPIHNFRIHDRYLIGNYFSVFAPSGFEILPLKQDEKNDTKLIVRSIFDKTMYDDFKEFIPIYQSYVKWVNMTEKAEYQIPFS